MQGQGEYLNYCPAPGLAVGTLELLEQWREDLLSRHEPVLSPIIEVHQTTLPRSQDTHS